MQVKCKTFLFGVDESKSLDSVIDIAINDFLKNSNYEYINHTATITKKVKGYIYQTVTKPIAGINRNTPELMLFDHKKHFSLTNDQSAPKKAVVVDKDLVICLMFKDFSQDNIDFEALSNEGQKITKKAISSNQKIARPIFELPSDGISNFEEE